MEELPRRKDLWATMEAMRHKNNGNYGSYLRRIILNRPHRQHKEKLVGLSRALYKNIRDAEPRKTPKLHWNLQVGQV